MGAGGSDLSDPSKLAIVRDSRSHLQKQHRSPDAAQQNPGNLASPHTPGFPADWPRSALRSQHTPPSRASELAAEIPRAIATPPEHRSPDAAQRNLTRGTQVILVSLRMGDDRIVLARQPACWRKFALQVLTFVLGDMR
jgi:hypothetical protein